MLAVIGLVIGGIWVAATAVNDKLALNRFMERLSRISADIQQNFKPMPTTLGTGMAIYLKGKGLYQASEAASTGTFFAPELGPTATVDYEYYGYNHATADQRGLNIRVWDISKKNCRPFIARLVPLTNTMTVLGTTYTPTMIAEMNITVCESSNFINWRLTAIVP